MKQITILDVTDQICKYNVSSTEGDGESKSVETKECNLYNFPNELVKGVE